MPNGFLTATRPILIVDDVASGAMTLDPLCQSTAGETMRAGSGAEAGAIFAHTAPAAIITDCVMPGAGGLDCLFLIADRAPSVPVRVVTASERLPFKAAGERRERDGRSDLACAHEPLDRPILAAFIAGCGVPFKPRYQSVH